MNLLLGQPWFFLSENTLALVVQMYATTSSFVKHNYKMWCSVKIIVQLFQ